jgi:EpsI family protein
MRNTRLFIAAGLFGVGCLLIAGVRPQLVTPLPESLDALPLTLVGVVGTDQPISEEEQRVAGMSDYMYRTYFSADTSIAFSVYVGYYESQATGKTIHSPKNCLPGAGWETLTSERSMLEADGATHTVNRVLLANGGVQAVVYYWYQGRGRVAANEYLVKWDLLRDAALKGRTEESLVRIIVPVKPQAGMTGSWGPAQLHADSLARRIAVELIPEVGAAMPPWDGTAITMSAAEEKLHAL